MDAQFWKWENSGPAIADPLGLDSSVFWCPDFPRDERKGVSGGRRCPEDRRLTFGDMWDEIKLPRYSPAVASYVPVEYGMVQRTTSERRGRKLRFMEQAVLCQVLG